MIVIGTIIGMLYTTTWKCNDYDYYCGHHVFMMAWGWTAVSIGIIGLILAIVSLIKFN